MHTTPQETSEWLDGEKLAGWIEENRPESTHLQLGNHSRRLFAWKNGERANVYTADAVLIKLGLHLSEVPSEFYLSELDRGKLAGAPLEKLRAGIRAGDPTGVIASAVGCSASTVRNHRAQLKTAA